MESIVIGLLSLATAFLILGPLVRTAWNGYDWDGSGSTAAGTEPAPALKAEVDQYRAAIRAGTLCDRCGHANPAESRFCAECGRPLAGSPMPA